MDSKICSIVEILLFFSTERKSRTFCTVYLQRSRNTVKAWLTVSVIIQVTCEDQQESAKVDATLRLASSLTWRTEMKSPQADLKVHKL